MNWIFGVKSDRKSPSVNSPWHDPEREGKRKGTGVLTHRPEHQDPTPAEPSGAPHPLADDLKLATHTASFYTLQASTRHASRPRASAPARPRPGRAAILRLYVPTSPCLALGLLGGERRAAPKWIPGYGSNAASFRLPPPRSPLSLIVSSLQTASTEWNSLSSSQPPRPASQPGAGPGNSGASSHGLFPLRELAHPSAPAATGTVVCAPSGSAPRPPSAPTRSIAGSRTPRSTGGELGAAGWSGVPCTRPACLSSCRAGLLTGLQRRDRPLTAGILASGTSSSTGLGGRVLLDPWLLIKMFCSMSQP